MAMAQSTREALVFRAEERLWIEPPQHYGAYSKLLINADNAGSQHLDVRISSYQPKGASDEHVHERAEQVYYILRGRGLMVLDGERAVVEPNTTIFIPPGVRHALYNTGFEDLLFMVVTSPIGEVPLGVANEAGA